MREHLQAIFANEELIGEEPKMTSKELEMLRSLDYIE